VGIYQYWGIIFTGTINANTSRDKVNSGSLALTVYDTCMAQTDLTNKYYQRQTSTSRRHAHRANSCR